MSDPAKGDMPADATAAGVVVCAKCGFGNRGGDDFCDQCNANLYLRCDHCGQRNQRIRSRCAQCGRRLHRWFWRWRYRFGRLFPPTAKIKFSHLILFLILILLVYKIVVMLAGYRVSEVPADLGL